MSDIRRQELHCHGCGNYVQFDFDLELDGKHVLNCPKCGHEHCRIVRDGVITDERWDSRNGQVYRIRVSTMTSSSTSQWVAFKSTSSGTERSFLFQAWTNTTVYK